MAEPIVIPPGGGEVVGDAPDRRVEILSDAGSLHATWTRFGPGRDGANLHIHRRHTDLFYILAGEMTVRLGADDRQVVAPAGSLAFVPPLVVHGFRNGSEQELRYLNLHAPGEGFADYMRGIRDGERIDFDQDDPPADGGRPPEDAAIGAAGPVGDGVTLLADLEAIAVAEIAGDRAEAPHTHRRHTESLYVLEGSLTLTTANADITAAAGTWLQLPPGLEHAVSGARYLEIHTPG